MMQEAMEPEAVASGLVAGDDGRALRKFEPRLGASDLSQDRAVSRAGTDTIRARWPRAVLDASYHCPLLNSKAM